MCIYVFFCYINLAVVLEEMAKKQYFLIILFIIWFWHKCICRFQFIVQCFNLRLILPFFYSDDFQDGAIPPPLKKIKSTVPVKSKAKQKHEEAKSISKQSGAVKRKER